MSTNGNDNNNKGLVLGQDLPPHLLAKLKASSEAHTQRVKEAQKRLGAYPDPEAVTEFDEVDVTEIKLGKSGIFGGNADQFRGGRKGRNRGQQRGNTNQGGGKGKGGGGGRALPDPRMVHGEVAKMLAHLPVAGNTGNLQVGEFNAEFMDQSKARYFQDSYVEVVSRFHVLLLEEVDSGGVSHLGKVTGYQPFCSTANTRSQAVGFLVHPRLKVLQVTEYSSIANVQGIPDLRPAYRLDLQDSVSGEKFSVVVLHLKSMRGGPQVTAVVRHKQFSLLVKDLGPNYVGLVGGDLNYKIDDPSCKDADPMYQAGYTLVAKGDNSATQIMGSRIDGFFEKGMSGKTAVDFYRVYAYFLNPNLKRAFSDHATLKLEVLVSSKKSNEGSSGTSTGGSDLSSLIGGAALPVIVRAVKGRTRTPAPSRKGGRDKK